MKLCKSKIAPQASIHLFLKVSAGPAVAKWGHLLICCDDDLLNSQSLDLGQFPSHPQVSTFVLDLSWLEAAWHLDSGKYR